MYWRYVNRVEPRLHPRRGRRGHLRPAHHPALRARAGDHRRPLELRDLPEPGMRRCWITSRSIRPTTRTASSRTSTGRAAPSATSRRISSGRSRPCRSGRRCARSCRISTRRWRRGSSVRCASGSASTCTAGAGVHAGRDAGADRRRSVGRRAVPGVSAVEGRSHLRGPRLSLLDEHVERFNAGVRSGDFGPMVAAFADDGELVFGLSRSAPSPAARRSMRPTPPSRRTTRSCLSTGMGRMPGQESPRCLRPGRRPTERDGEIARLVIRYDR